MQALYTIGYAPFTPESFVQALRRHGIDAVADVRSSPYSAHRPEFNRESIKAVLRREGLHYVFLGDQVGARFEDQSVYRGGQVDFELAARHPNFQQGLERLRKGGERHTIALMCAEKDPMTCHRTILVARHLARKFAVRHILEQGEIETHEALERRLLKAHKLDQLLLPGIGPNSLDEAYARQGRHIAHRREEEECSEAAS